MKELVSLVINTLGEMENSESIKISKENDSKYVFTGIGQDVTGVQYDYKISVEYKVLPTEGEEQVETNIEMLKKQVDMLEKKDTTAPVIVEEK